MTCIPGTGVVALDLFPAAEVVPHYFRAISPRSVGAVPTRLIVSFCHFCVAYFMLRQQVMAANLLSLQGRQSTVAVVGLAHMDGIEAILAANGWKSKRC